MRNSFLMQVAIGIAGVLFVLLLNTAPLSRLGIAVSLPVGWKDTPSGAYADLSCSSRHIEGIPFTIKRPNKLQSCSFDTNMLAFFLDGASGALLAILSVFILEKRWTINKTQEL